MAGFWRRVFGRGEAEAPAEPPASAPPSEAPAPLPTAEEQLRALGDAGTVPPDVDLVLRLVADVSGQGREARAIDLARRVVAAHPELEPVTQRLAELLSARGDDAGAEALLATMADPSVEATMLRGEIAERRGDLPGAIAAYERVLARDLDYPGARERVERLRGEGEPDQALAGATLLTDGALARGRYRVLRELGRGGAGTVFAARDTSLGRRVALKVYHRRGPLERERLRMEAQTPARLEHPGVVRVFDLDEPLGAIAMEWVQGGSIRQELRRGAIPVARLVRWLSTALDALDYVHRHGFAHRDLKPSNMLLRADDRVVLTDFGLAAQIGESRQERGGGEGTLAYMAPEQRAGAPADPAADVHALGASMREILGQASGDVPPSLVELAEACTRADPAARPTVRELSSRLQSLG